MSSDEGRLRGQRNEARSVECLTEKGVKMPLWFGMVKKASKALDSHGIDVVVVIKSFDNRWCCVPIQVKSSHKEKLKFGKTHPLHHKARVPIIVVEDNHTTMQLRNHILCELQKVREIADTFSNFMRSLMGKKVKFAPKSNWRKNKKVQRKLGLERRLREQEIAQPTAMQAAK